MVLLCGGCGIYGCPLSVRFALFIVDSCIYSLLMYCPRYCLQVVVAFSVRKPLGGEVPRLTAEMNSLELSVMKRSFDLTVDATIGLGALVDHSVEGKLM